LRILLLTARGATIKSSRETAINPATIRKVDFMNKPKPDDRSDNESKIKRAMSNTESQMKAANEVIAQTDNPKTRADLTAKNQRREQALHDMEIEMKQEAEWNRHND